MHVLQNSGVQFIISEQRLRCAIAHNPLLSRVCGFSQHRSWCFCFARSSRPETAMRGGLLQYFCGI